MLLLLVTLGKRDWLGYVVGGLEVLQCGSAIGESSAGLGLEISAGNHFGCRYCLYLGEAAPAVEHLRCWYSCTSHALGKRRGCYEIRLKGDVIRCDGRLDVTILVASRYWELM